MNRFRKTFVVMMAMFILLDLDVGVRQLQQKVTKGKKQVGIQVIKKKR